MKSGLRDQDLQLIQNAGRQFPQIETIILFGSRAMGNFKKGSDVDLALTGNLNLQIISQFKSLLENDIPVPYFFDVIDYASIENRELKTHIDQFGEVIYRK